MIAYLKKHHKKWRKSNSEEKRQVRERRQYEKDVKRYLRYQSKRKDAVLTGKFFIACDDKIDIIRGRSFQDVNYVFQELVPRNWTVSVVRVTNTSTVRGWNFKYAKRKKSLLSKAA